MSTLKIVLVAVLLMLPQWGTTAHSVSKASATTQTAPDFASSAWLPSWEASAATDVVANSDLFDSANLFWWDVTGCRSMKTLRTSPADRERLRGSGLRQVGTLTASGLDPRAAVACLGSPVDRAAHVRMLVDFAARNRLAGLDLDYEHLALTTSRRQAGRVRAVFTALVSDLCPALHAQGRTCTVTVMPRWSDQAEVWRDKAIPWIYDYAALGRSADRLRVMAYDQHAHQFGPGPIAGYPWVRRIVTWALTQVRPFQVELGVPTYGRDFSRGEHRHLFRADALALARRVGATPRFDPRQRELTFTYVAAGVKHTVWFSDPRAVAARTQLAQDMDLAGVVYWAAALGQPGTWAAVRHVRGL